MIDIVIAFFAGVVCCLVFLMFIFSVIVLAAESGHRDGYQPKETRRKDPPQTGSAVLKGDDLDKIIKEWKKEKRERRRDEKLP